MRHLLVLVAVVLACAGMATTAASQTEAPGLRWSLKPRLEFNNHIEFGISVDPSTVSSSRTSPQLKGTLRTVTASVEGHRVLGDIEATGSFAPTAQDYAGEDGFLDQFDGYRVPVTGRLVYRPSQAWPLLRLDARVTRATREADIYNHWEPTVELGVGEVLSYEVRRRVFDDPDTREDYLLISSTRHAGRASLRVAGGARTRIDTTYTLQHERYGTNLSSLLYIATGVDSDFRRADTRHLFDATALRVFGDHLLARVGASGMWNRSNSDFYDFRTSAVALLAFWSPAEGRWLRLEGRRSWLRYGGRATGGPFDRATPLRRDASWQGVLTSEVRVADALALTVGVDVLRNQTNDTRDELDFLNYTQAIFRFGASASY